MGILLLVRHGQASWGAENYDQLSEIGWEQGRILGRALAERGIQPDLVVSGGMQRHQETCAGVLESLGGREVLIDPGWNEFDHVEVFRKIEHKSGFVDSFEEFERVVVSRRSRCGGWPGHGNAAVVRRTPPVRGQSNRPFGQWRTPPSTHRRAFDRRRRGRRAPDRCWRSHPPRWRRPR